MAGKKKNKYNIGKPDKERHIVEWVTQEYFNDGDVCEVCGGAACNRQEGFNSKTGQCLVMFSCQVLECQVEVSMRIYMEIK